MICNKYILKLCFLCRNIHDREIKQLEEMHDRKHKRLIEYYENQYKAKRKRMKDDIFDDIEMDDRVEQMEKDLKLQQSEIDSLRQMVQQLNSENRKLQKKCTQLEFDLSEKNRLFKAAVKRRETDGCDDYELVKELESQVQQSETKITVSRVVTAGSTRLFQNIQFLKH